jgi:hypothetical protein
MKGVWALSVVAAERIQIEAQLKKIDLVAIAALAISHSLRILKSIISDCDDYCS